ncbi:MAG: hypothetical protein ACRD43_10800 [Pyrinomonadaceae bacterium]
MILCKTCKEKETLIESQRTRIRQLERLVTATARSAEETITRLEDLAAKNTRAMARQYLRVVRSNRG